MERVTDGQCKIEEAVLAIEVFLQQTSEDANLVPMMLERLSSAIEAARRARESSIVASGGSIAREERYRTSLERLRTRLSEIGCRLLKERDRVMDDQAHVSQTLAWNRSLNKTH
ncbi:MAG TPA: hypothetical protein VGL89_07625 [Candidatus Koribacter sp.]|jgi:hypothetical protein